jgi:hypothetical protein
MTRAAAVLALDLYTTTCWALRTGDGRIASSTQSFCLDVSRAVERAKPCNCRQEAGDSQRDEQ